MSDETKTGTHAASVLGEVARERRRQDDKWGQQDHPDGLQRMVTCDGREDGWGRGAVCSRPPGHIGRCFPSPKILTVRGYGSHLESIGRSLLDATGDPGATGTENSWAGIVLEELGEALQSSTAAELRSELVQVAAVVAAWIEAIDRRAA